MRNCAITKQIDGIRLTAPAALRLLYEIVVLGNHGTGDMYTKQYRSSSRAGHREWHAGQKEKRNNICRRRTAQETTQENFHLRSL